jgi:hypothetical protein
MRKLPSYDPFLNPKKSRSFFLLFLFSFYEICILPSFQELDQLRGQVLKQAEPPDWKIFCQLMRS